jgi:hypothetical protein
LDPVLPLCKIALDDWGECGIAEPAAHKSIQERREPRNGGCCNNSTRPQNALGLRQRTDSLGPVRDVVERLKNQDRVA